MTTLNVREIEDLMEALESWEHGCPILVAEKVARGMHDDLIKKVKEDPENMGKLGPSVFSLDPWDKVQEVIDSRKEPAILLKAKLITIRGEILGSEANKILQQPDKG